MCSKVNNEHNYGKAYYKKIVVLTRNLTDWKTWALKIQARGAPVFYALENSKYVENLKKVGRSLKEISSLELENQFSKFLERIEK